MTNYFDDYTTTNSFHKQYNNLWEVLDYSNIKQRYIFVRNKLQGFYTLFDHDGRYIYKNSPVVKLYFVVDINSKSIIDCLIVKNNNVISDTNRSIVDNFVSGDNDFEIVDNVDNTEYICNLFSFVNSVEYVVKTN